MHKTTLFLITLFIFTFCNCETKPASEPEEDFKHKLEVMINLLCNIETKKYMVLNNETLKELLNDPNWPQISKKLVGVLMKECMIDINDPTHFSKIATAVSEEERSKVRFPFLDRIKPEDITKMGLELTEEELSLQDLFSRIEDGMAKMKEEENKKKQAEIETKTEEVISNDKKNEFAQIEETEL